MLVRPFMAIVFLGCFAGPVSHVEAGERRTATTITMVVGGDLGLNADKQPVNSSGTFKHGTWIDWHTLTSGIEDLVNGDINFANLETVVTDRNELPAQHKKFNFRAHPDGIAHLARLGFNLLSTANNHAIDYGRDGILDTITYLDALRSRNLILGHAGVGANRSTAIKPTVFSKQGLVFGFAAIGIDSGGRATETLAGLPAWRSAEDEKDLVGKLDDIEAAFRIVSVHHGQERSPYPDEEVKKRLRLMLNSSKVNLVLGHHAHVVQGIELIGEKALFYGLGNLLHPGMADMGLFGPCRDYGILVKLHYRISDDSSLSLGAIEVFPLTDMHLKSRRMEPAKASERVRILNRLSASLGGQSVGGVGLQLMVRSDGSGLYCSASGGAGKDQIAKLCEGWRFRESDLLPSSGSCSGVMTVFRTPERKRSGRLPVREEDRSWVRESFSQN